MRVLLVGDTHGNSMWWSNVVERAALYTEADAICQLGDFGFWPSSEDFIGLTRKSQVPVFFIDGNHEHHEALSAACGDDMSSPDLISLGGNLFYMPRGSRVSWGGVKVAALGGARSIDRAWRTPGHDWFYQEAVTTEDLKRLACAGEAQILLCHDAPLCADVPLSPRKSLSLVWQAELATCEAHREIIDAALDAVKPELLMHGHYHVRWSGKVSRDWGECQIEGLAEDGSGFKNLAVLDCSNGAFSLSDVPDIL